MTPPLGVIEGYFGRVWSWDDRAHVMRTLADAGYGFFHYAPKAEARLRRRWRDPFDDAALGELVRFARLCRSHGVRMGIGLTPFEAHLGFGTEARRDLRAKLRQLETIGLDDLVIMFDDMRGDVAYLARRQAEIVEVCMGEGVAERHFVVPSYYSDDPVLDRAFGQRPPRYLSDLGRGLPTGVSVYWTGEEVCSREYRIGHLDRVAEDIGRPVALWDNYPVNDGPRKAGFLNLRAFTGRPATLGHHLSHHAVNPLSQPWLGLIPALTLPMSYQRAETYEYGAALHEAAARMLGQDLAAMVIADLPILQDAGLIAAGDALPDLIERYRSIDHPAAAEIVDWAQGGYAIVGESVLTQ